MNYLTNYYKNLSEQLQQQVTMLEAELHEKIVRYDPNKKKSPTKPNIPWEKPENKQFIGKKSSENKTSDKLEEAIQNLVSVLNEVKITKFVNGQAVKYEPRVGPAGESDAEVKAGVYPGDENNRLSDEGKIRVNKENEAEAKKLRDMKRTSVETSSESPEQSAAKEKEQQRRAKWDYIESDRNDTRQGPSRGREYR